jgi:hypothetical protein
LPKGIFHVRCGTKLEARLALSTPKMARKGLRRCVVVLNKSRKSSPREGENPCSLVTQLK